MGRMAEEINFHVHPKPISTYLRFLFVEFPSDVFDLRFHSLSERCELIPDEVR